MAQTDGVKESLAGAEYTIYMLDPKTSLRLLRRILGVVSPALGAFAGLGTKNGSPLEADVNPELFSKLAGELFERLDEKLLDDLVAHLSGVTLVDGKKLDPILEVHFRGKIGLMVKWLALALRVQYADFFDEAKAAIARAAEAMGQRASLSPQGSPTTG